MGTVERVVNPEVVLTLNIEIYESWWTRNLTVLEMKAENLQDSYSVQGENVYSLRERLKKTLNLNHFDIFIKNAQDQWYPLSSDDSTSLNKAVLRGCPEGALKGKMDVRVVPTKSNISTYGLLGLLLIGAGAFSYFKYSKLLQ